MQHLYANAVDNTCVIFGIMAWNSFCHSSFVLRYRPLLDEMEMEMEIISDYNKILCKAKLDPEERKHRKIHTFPTVYPSIVIRAPVPWHSTFVISSHMLHHRLFIVNPILLSLRDLWECQWVFRFMKWDGTMKNSKCR